MLFYWNRLRDQTAAGKVTIEEVTKELKDFDFDMIDNSNLSRAHLNGRGLDLNTKGMEQFAKNLIEGIRKLWNKKKLASQNIDLLKSHAPHVVLCAIWYLSYNLKNVKNTMEESYF